MKIILPALFLLFINSVCLAGNFEKTFASAFQKYTSGDYQGSLTSLQILETSTNKEQKGVLYYLMGKNHFKLQNFQKSISFFQKAKKFGAKMDDIDYLMAQSFYGDLDLQKARGYFARSAKNNFKQGHSLYYLGYISQSLEENKKAKNYYKKIIKDKEDKDNVKKGAMFQLAELEYAEMLKKTKGKKKQKELVSNKILPKFQEAKIYNIEEPFTKVVSARIIALQRKHDIEIVKRMKNGRAIAEKPLRMSLTAGSKFDSNVTLTGDDDQEQATDKASLYESVSFFTNYEMEFDRLFFVKPELSASLDYYNNRDEGEIFENDNYSITPGIKTSYEHKLFDKRAKTIFNYEYNYMAKDYNQAQSMEYYSSHHAFTVGEEFEYFDWGSTTISGKYKIKDSYSDTQKSTSFSTNIRQVFTMAPKSMVSRITYSLNADFARYENASSSNTNTFANTFSFFMPEKYWKYYTLSPSLSITLTDPIESRDSRGIEQTYNPSISASRSFGKFEVTAKYGFTQKVSKDTESYAYSKHEIGLSVDYSL